MSSCAVIFFPPTSSPKLDRAGFDACIAVQAQHTLEETNWLLRLAAESPFIAGVIGWVDLRASNVRDKLIELVKNPKLLGIRHVLQGEP